jgi:hypothetical protein
VRAALPPVAFDAATAAGHALTIRDAVALAVEE